MRKPGSHQVGSGERSHAALYPRPPSVQADLKVPAPMKYVFILMLLVVGAAAGAWGGAIVVRWNDNMTHTARIMPGERVF